MRLDLPPAPVFDCLQCTKSPERFSCVHSDLTLVWFLDPSYVGGAREEGRKGLVNNSTLMQIHGCIPAVSVDEGKCECQVGVSCE